MSRKENMICGAILGFSSIGCLTAGILLGGISAIKIKKAFKKEVK